MMHWISADWPAPKRVHAGVTLRTGGNSQGGFNSLNLATHVGDDLNHVLANRALLKHDLALPTEPAWLNQTHSNRVVCADTLTELSEADASYTQKSHCVCAVLTADCLPILLCDSQGKSIAAIHAGWRGLLNGIIENTLATMPRSSERMAWLGPAIGVQCFEVGSEVRQAFIKKSALFSAAFTLTTADKYLADIYSLARIILQHADVQKIYGGGFCTVTDKERFFSYRREAQTGRMASFIWLDSCSSQ